MLTLDTIEKNFNTYKKIILECLINYYGEEYRYEILEKAKYIYFNFASTPDEEYQFLLRHIQNHTSTTIKSVLEKQEEYCKMEKKYKFVYSNAIKDALKESKNIESKEVNHFINEMLEKSITMNKIKELLKLLKIENASLEFLEQTYAICLKIQKDYRKQIVRELSLELQIKEDIKNQFSIDLSDYLLQEITFKTYPCAGNIYSLSNEENPVGSFIRIPVIYLLNHNVKSLDVCLIHEIIHKIETNDKYVGISIEDKEKTNHIANEIRTQKLAIYITNILHKKGIFIFDNPEDFQLENDSKYEDLFILTGMFFEEYEDFIKKCAIQNTPKLLEMKFGQTWNLYAKFLNHVYEDRVKRNKIINQQMLKDSDQMLENMNDYVQIKEQEKNNNQRPLT